MKKKIDHVFCDETKCVMNELGEVWCFRSKHMVKWKTKQYKTIDSSIEEL